MQKAVGIDVRIGEHSGRGEHRKVWTCWPQSVVGVEARFVVSGCEGCAEETREERERGAKVSGERRESEEGGRAVRRVRLSEP